jgi:hypothetical protein
MPIFEGKYEYIEAGIFDRSYLELPNKLRTLEFRGIAGPFIASNNRLLSFFEFPLQMIYWALRLGQIRTIARYQAGVDPEDESRDDEPAVRAAMLKQYEKMSKSPPTQKEALTFSSYVVGSILGDVESVAVQQACDGIEAALAAMIMTAYATFETLATDLWVSSVNRHTALANNWVEKNQGKQLTLKDMAGHGWNLSNRVGTLLHQSRRITFESLNEIRSAYSQAFKGELDSVFESHLNLVKAEKTRHLFAHRGGLIDRKFQDEMRNFDEYKKVVVGERLRLTGPVTGNLVGACVGCGVSLLLGVDNWSQNNL